MISVQHVGAAIQVHTLKLSSPAVLSGVAIAPNCWQLLAAPGRSKHAYDQKTIMWPQESHQSLAGYTSSLHLEKCEQAGRKEGKKEKLVLVVGQES